MAARYGMVDRYCAEEDNRGGKARKCMRRGAARNRVTTSYTNVLPQPFTCAGLFTIVGCTLNGLSTPDCFVYLSFAYGLNKEGSMGASILVDLPDEVRSALDEATRSEGVSASEIIERALKSYLFVRRFRELREETLEHMRATGRGDLTDEDVFRIIS